MSVSLRSQSFDSVRWTGVATAVRVILQFFQIAILARLLTPEDFGLMAIIAALVAILGLFSDLGLSKAIIHHSEITSEQLSSLYWLNLGAALLLMLGMAGTAPLIGYLYSEPRLVPILIIAGLVFPFGAIGYQFRVLAEKGLRFSILARVEMASNLFGFVCAITIALAGGGVWAIVAGMLASAACASALSWWLLSLGWRPGWHLHVAECRSFLHFGGYSIGETLANTVRMQTDVFIGGLLFGPAALGLYSLPRELGLRIAFMINPIITRVGFPVMSRTQQDTFQLKAIYLQILRMTASVNFPIYLALALFAEETVVLLFGERWGRSALYLQIFSVLGLIRSTGNPSGSLLYAVGRARLAFWWNMALLTIVPPVLLIGASLGDMTGLAWTMLIVQVGIFVPAWWFLIRPLCGASFAEYVGQLVPPLLIALAAGGCAYGLVMILDHGSARLVLGLAVGAMVYLALSIRFNRIWVAAMWELLSPLWKAPARYDFIG